MKTSHLPSSGPEESGPTVYIDFRSLLVCGVFCALAGAWLTLITEVRTLALRSDSDAPSAGLALTLPKSPSPSTTMTIDRTIDARENF